MKHTLYILFIIIILAFSGCKKDDVQVLEFKITSESVYKNTSTIIITVTYTYTSVIQSVECYISESSDMTNALHVHGEINKNTFILTFKDLHANTTYYYYYEYSNGIDHFTESEIKVATTNDYGLPTVITNDVTDITTTSAICGGYVTDDGGLTVTSRGVCWSTNQNPTTNDAHSNDGSGIGSYTSQLTSLSDNTTYYVRAYAINSIGTSYGEQKTFKILPEGCINGLFSVSSYKQVYFSQANLQYQASTNTWRFAENQWDYIGDDNSNISSSYCGWIDLLGWGTSGYNHGAVCYQPWSTSTTTSDYYAYGSDTYNLNDQTGLADWGYNPISNGGNQPNQWRTLTNVEWEYVLNKRITPSGIRYAKAKVNEVNGVILLPDDWSTSYYNLSNTNTGEASYSSNTISASQWNNLEQHGAVFLAAAGYRYGTQVYDIGSLGLYWSATSATYYDNLSAYGIYFYDSYLNPSYNDYRSFGRCVRLVYSAEN